MTDFTTKPRKYYADRLWNYPTGAGLPSGFTARWATTNISWSVQAETADGAPSDKEIKATITLAGHYAVSFDRAGQRANVDALVLVLAPGTSGTSSHGGVAIRISGSAGSENAYTASLRSSAGAASSLRLMKLVAGTETQIAVHSLTWTANTWYYIRLRSFGTSLKSKIWALGSAEPSSWQIDTTDSDVTGAGYCGIYVRHAGTNPAISYIAVSQNFAAPRVA